MLTASEPKLFVMQVLRSIEVAWETPLSVKQLDVITVLEEVDH